MRRKVALIQILIGLFLLQGTCADNDRPNLYILMLGTSGCGKSSTINYFLNKAVAGVGHSDSTTSAIHEYSVQTSATADAGNITFIDTPGFGDTRGLQYDAQFLASLQQYFETHSQLSSRQPDIVLLCHRYDDNRFSGQQSQFVKMLRGIGLIADSWYSPRQEPNTALLLTHSKTAEDSELRIPMYRQTLENFTQFPSSLTILLGDNKLNLAEVDSSEEESSEQPIRNFNAKGWYPANVCKWMKTALGNPTLASMVDKLCTLDYNFVEETAQFKLLGIQDTKASDMLRMLTKLELQIEETPVSLKLKNATASGQAFAHDTLPYIQKALNLLRIVNLDDVPRTNAEIARLFRSLRSDSGVLILLKAAFQIEPPELPSGSNLATGFSYDKTKETTLSKSIFTIDKFEAPSNALGYKIPSAVSCDYAAAAGQQNPRLRIQKTASQSDGALTVEFQFMNCKVKEAARITEAYQEAVQKLGTFAKEDFSSIWKWKSFLAKYGTHVVQEGHLGGMIQLSNVPTSWKSESVAELLKKLETGHETKYIQMRMAGGNHAYHTNSPAGLFRGQLYQTWLKSIEDNPVSLPGSVVVKPIEDYLRLVNANLANELASASEYFSSFTEEVFVKSLKESRVEFENLNKTLASVQTELDSQTFARENCQNALSACMQDKNTTLQQSFQIAQKLQVSENTVREVRTKLTAIELEKTSLNSENENHKSLLNAARAETSKEQAHSQELNRLLQHCDSRANSAQISLNNCNIEKEACEGRHRGHGNRHNWRRWRQN